VAASKMSACGMAAPAAVLRLCRCQQTHYGGENQNYVRRPPKEGNSIGHGLPISQESTSSLLLFMHPGA